MIWRAIETFLLAGLGAAILLICAAFLVGLFYSLSVWTAAIRDEINERLDR